MNENISTISSEDAVFGVGLAAFKVIVCAGLTAGVLDCVAASLNGVFKGTSPVIVWQYVASGLLGKNSYSYGLKSVALGLLIHFFIAFSAALIYYAASRQFPILVHQAMLFGAFYGVAVYLIMAYVVTPLSAASKMPFSISSMVVGLLVHIFCVGLPIALITRQFAKSDSRISL